MKEGRRLLETESTVIKFERMWGHVVGKQTDVLSLQLRTDTDMTLSTWRGESAAIDVHSHSLTVVQSEFWKSQTNENTHEIKRYHKLNSKNVVKVNVIVACCWKHIIMFYFSNFQNIFEWNKQKSTAGRM